MRVHTRVVLMCFRVSTLNRWKTIELHVVTSVALFAHVPNARSWDIFGHRFLFDVFSTVHNNTICMRFRFDPLSKAFLNRCVFDENGQRQLVWTEGLNALKYIPPWNENTFCKSGHDDFSRYENAEFQTIKSLPFDKKRTAFIQGIICWLDLQKTASSVNISRSAW